MSKQAFEEHREKDGWSDAEEDDSGNEVAESLSFGQLNSFVLSYLHFY